MTVIAELVTKMAAATDSLSKAQQNQLYNALMRLETDVRNSDTVMPITGGITKLSETLVRETTIVDDTRQVIAGNGLTGGGSLAADITLNVAAAAGITVSADAVAVNQAYAFNWTAAHTWAATVTFNGAIDANSTSNFQGAAVFQAQLQDPTFASQTTGWRMTSGGDLDCQSIYANELSVKVFIADMEQALAGGQIITPSVAKVYADFTVPASTASAYLYVEDLPGATGMAVFQSGDIVRLRHLSRIGGGLSVSDCWGTVASYLDMGNGYQRWTYTRSAPGYTGTMGAGEIIHAGSLALDYATSPGGYYEVTTVDGTYGSNSPYLQIVSWVTHPAASANRSVRLRGGNLNGITSVPNEFGLYVGTGAVAVTDTYFRVSAVHGGTSYFEIHNIPLNMYNGSTNTISLQSDGDSFFGSNVAAAATTAFSIFTNAQTYNSESMGAGDVLFGCNSANYANMLWDVSDKQLKFRGGTTTRLFIHTDGYMYSGSTIASSGAQVKFGTDGLSVIQASTTLATDPMIWFMAQTTKFASIRGDQPGAVNGNGYMYLDAYGTGSGSDGYVSLRAFSGTYASPGADPVTLWLDGAASAVNMSGFGTYVQFRMKGPATATKDMMFVDTTSSEEWALSMRTHAETGDNPFKLYYFDGSSTWLAVQTWYKDGTVGIGTETPSAKLDVAGTIRATSSTTPTAGTGIEIYYNAADDYGAVIAYDRAGNASKRIFLRASANIISAPIADPGASAMLRSDSANLGSVTPYLDQTNHRLYWRVKYDDNTDKTCYIALS